MENSIPPERYTVIKAENLDKMHVYVNTYMDNGWIPQGGVTTIFGGNAYHWERFYQAMIKKETT